MIKIGDKVKFLNDVGGGIVKSFINKNTVNVEGDDGFEIPYPISQLLNVSDPELNKIDPGKEQTIVTEDNQQEPVFTEPAGEIINGKNSPDFYFCFVPSNAKNPLEGEIELFLVNDSNFTVLYRFSEFNNGKNISIKHGVIPSNSNAMLKTIYQDDLVDFPEYAFQITYFREEEDDWHDPVLKKFKISPVKFYKESTFHSNSFFKKNALILQIAANPMATEIDKLTLDDFQKVVKEKEVKSSRLKNIKKSTVDEMVVDLHINELLDSSSGLSNREMLEIQMEKVESEMNLAIKNKVKRIVFIHGVGQGVLKQEVAKLLQRKFKKYYFQDASFQEYGYGATMVSLRK